MSKGTPVRRALREGSSLLKSVKDGLGAVESSHRAYLHEEIRGGFSDSLDIDEALKKGREQENRWDYLLGHTASDTVVAVEPHSAKEDQVSTIIKKREAALQQLRDHLRDDKKIAKWLWVASGAVHFASIEKTEFRLAQKGIEFVGKRVRARHLASPPKGTGKKRSKRKR